MLRPCRRRQSLFSASSSSEHRLLYQFRLLIFLS